MAGQDTVAVFNNTQRIITLKGQVPNKDKRNRKNDPKRFCSRLQPGILSFVPKAFWAIYKRNAVTQDLIDEEKLLINREPASAKAKASKAKARKSAEEVARDAALAELKENGEGDE